jgi:hypothetical protein
MPSVFSLSPVRDASPGAALSKPLLINGFQNGTSLARWTGGEPTSSGSPPPFREVHMRSAFVGLLVLGAMGVRAPLAAQVQADVVVHEGPVSARVRVGDRDISLRDPYMVRHGQVIAWGRPVARVVVVEPARQRGHGWWKRQGYRPTTLWFDGYRFYDRPFRRHGLREVLVFQRRGHFVMVGDFYRSNRYYGAEPWYHDDRYVDRERRYERRDREWDD